MKSAAIILLALCLTGCVKSDANIYQGGLVGQRVVGNEVAVTITNVWNQADAFGLAEQHCRKYQRAARPSGHQGYTYSFDCIAP